MPDVLRVPQAPSSGSPYLELPRKPEPPRFAKDLSRRPRQFAGGGLLGLFPAASEHPVFPCTHTTTLSSECHLYYAPISKSKVAHFDGKRILITGGTGSLGKTLVRRFLAGSAGDP